MRTFTQKQNQPQKRISPSLARSKKVTLGPAHPVLHLQRTNGNQAVLRMCQPQQDDERERVQTKRYQANDAGPAAAPPIVHEVLAGPGQPLDSPTRAFFEPRFGHDFSRVRLHSDTKAAESARAVNALAYTVGQHVVFGANENSSNPTRRQQLLAHELTHVLQQSNHTDSPVVARQAAVPLPAPVPVRPPVRPPLTVIPGGRTGPGGRPLPVPEGQRYAPDPSDDSFEAALERANIRDYAERQRLEAERPVATLDRGGQAPNFVTEHGVRNQSWVGGPGGGGSVTARIRHFHVLDAIEHDVAQVTNEDQLRSVLEKYFPVEALLNQGIERSQRRFRLAPFPIRVPWDEPVFPDGLDPRAEMRLQVFQAAVQQRAQTVPALAQSRLIPQTRRRGGCRIEPISPLGDDPMSVLYCHLATGSPYSYKITIESPTTGGLTQRWAEIDSLRGNTWYECKCGYEALLRGTARGPGVARAVLERLDHQVLNHRDIARTCGLEYRYIVSNNYVAELLRQRWFGNVEVVVVPFEGCD